jgi:hypothetical protein
MAKKNRKRHRPAVESTPEVRRAGSAAPFVLLGVILAAALAIRIYPVIESPETFRGGLGIFGDTYLYNAIAHNLYRGNGFSGTDYGGSLGIGENSPDLTYEPAVSRAPLYPLFLAGVYSVFGRHEARPTPDGWRTNFDRVRLVQCVLDTVTCLLVFLMARGVFPAPVWPAIVAAALYAVCPYNIFDSRALLTESLASFLVAASTLVSVLALRRAKPLWRLLAGGGWGLAALCRPELLPVGVIVAGFLFLVNAGAWRIAGESLIAVVMGVVLVVAPWVLRNLVAIGQPVLTVGGLGYALYFGTFETNTNWTGWGQFPDAIFADPSEKEAVQSLNTVYAALAATGSVRIKEPDGRFLQMAHDRIRRDPWGTLQTWTIKIPRLWYQFYIPMYLRREASGAFFLFYFSFALYAFVSAPRERKVLMGPVALVFGYLTLLYLPLHVEPRYGVPCMPGLISLAGIGLWQACSRT